MTLNLVFQRQYLTNISKSFYLDLPKSIECQPNKLFDNTQVCTDFTLDIIENKYLICGFIDGNIVIYNISRLDNNNNNNIKLSKLFSLYKATNKHNKSNHHIKCVQWYPVDSGMFFTCSSDKKVKIWDSNRGLCVEEISLWYNINWLSLSSCSTNTNLVAAACDKSKVILIDLLSGASTHTLTNNYFDPVQTLQWSNKDEYLLATGDLGGHVSIWDVRKAKKPLYNLDQFQDRSCYSTNTSNCQAHSSAVRGLEFSPDGFSLATLGNDGHVHIWDLFSSGVKLKDVNFGKFPLADKTSRNIRFSWSGFSTYKKIWIPSNLEIVRLDIASGSIEKYFSMHFDQILSCIWNPGFQHFYTSSLDATIMYWKPSIY